MRKKSEGSTSVPGGGANNRNEWMVDTGGGCPNCGYCPHCGQSRQAAPYVPYNPWYPYQPYPVYPRVWLGGSTGQPVTLTTTDNPTGITYTI